MKNTNKILSLLFLICFSCAVFAEEPIAILVKFKGDVSVQSKDFKWKPLTKGYAFKSGDKLKTGPSAFCAIKFLDDKSLLRIKEKSTCTIEGKRKNNAIEKSIFTEVGSFFLSLFKQQESFKVSTPTSVASVKGTQFWVLQNGQSGSTLYVVTEGVVEVKNGAGKVLVKQGQTAKVNSRSSAPQVSLTQNGDIPADEQIGGAKRELDFEFTDASGKKMVLRMHIKGQE